MLGDITVKQFVYLSLDCGLKKCELWKKSDYIRTHCGSKTYRSHLIASKKIDILTEIGLDYKIALKLIIMEGHQKVNKKNLSLLGTPIWSGNMDELSNKQNLLNKTICNYYIKGMFNRKIQIIVKDDNEEISL